MRRIHGAALQQAFRDQLRAAAHHGAGTVLLVCLAEFADLAATAARERRDALRVHRNPGLLLGGLVGLLWLALEVCAYATPAGDPGGFAEELPGVLLLLAMPLAAALAGFAGGRRERAVIPGMREGVLTGLLGAAMMAAGIVTLMLFWMPALETTAQADPCLMRPFYASGSASFDTWLWRDNLGGATTMVIFATASGLILGAAGGMVGRLTAAVARA